MKSWKAGIFFLIAFFIQCSFLNVISIAGYTPNLLLCLVIVFSFLYEEQIYGLLYGVLKNWEPEKCLQFGWATGVLAASSLNDYAEPADEKQVWDIYAGNARVQR